MFNWWGLEFGFGVCGFVAIVIELLIVLVHSASLMIGFVWCVALCLVWWL